MKWYGKRNFMFLLFFIYIFVLVLFGFVYWNISNYSGGDFFIFQNDIDTDIKINTFKKEMNIKAYNRDINMSIKNLIVSNEYVRPILKLDVLNNNNKSIFVVDKTLGSNWANYYYSTNINKGINYMSIYNMGEDKINGRFNTCKIKVCFYKFKNDNYNMQDIQAEYGKKFSNNFYKVDTWYLWVNNYETIKKNYFKQKYYFYPLNFFFQKLMTNSISFPDESPIVLQKVSNGNFKYSIWNFIYFSAVTITTLGYGDILPNSTMVRIIVVIETMMGIIITGMLASCAFLNKK